MTIIDNSFSGAFTEGVSVSKTNVLINVIPTITDVAVGEVPANISDPDHSLNYTCGTSTSDFAVRYGAQTNISYVAVSGHTAASYSQATIQLYNGATLIDSVVLQRNNNVMFTFPSQSFSNLIVKFLTIPNNYQMTVTYIAAGEHITLAYGTQAGYKRNWLNRHTVQRTTTNLQVAPISTIQRSKALQGSLKLPNELASFAEDGWQTFMDFSYNQPFFLKEVSSQPESTYICYDPKFSETTHSSTTTLNVLMLSFTLFNGL
tara:strand:- start:602 stop:1384 length:783 start_codon:yes stop_codon:yes gene_type:complete